jgi:oligopeptidase B
MTLHFTEQYGKPIESTVFKGHCSVLTNVASLFLLFSLLLPVIPLITGCASHKAIEPPVAKVKPHTRSLHGDEWVDNYFWLRERDDPAVIEYLEKENRYTDAMMSHTEPLQDILYEEIIGRIKQTDLTVPEKIDDYYYYTRTEEGKQYRIYCRKKGSLDAGEEIFLDQNLLAEGHSYFDIGSFAISPDHRFLAFSIDTAGSERYVLLIKNLESGDFFSERIPDTGGSVAWANDNETIFYTVLDKAKRPYMVYRHAVGTEKTADVPVYHESDESFWISVYRTRSDAYILVETGSHTASEIYCLDADEPESVLTCIRPREKDVEYYVDHHDTRFFIMTNEDAKNFKIMTAPEHDPSAENWREFIAHRTHVKIEGLDIFKNHLVIFERENGLKEIRISTFSNDETHYIDFSEPVYNFWAGRNREYDTEILRFTYTSLVTPMSVFDYDMRERRRELRKQYEVLGGYDPAEYRSERIFASAPDDTLVPVSLVYSRGIVLDGTSPLFLVGYGAYGDSYDPYFSTSRLSLLDRGFIYAIAHVRGGGEKGRYWWEQGKLLNKMNTFTDFIACAEHLIDNGYTSNDRLVISGGSAGGLLVGAVLNIRPDLFHAAVADVPFVDLINTMLDPTIPLTVLEYEEWGNPGDRKFYDYMIGYSPYDNVTSQDYPNMLVTAGFHDSRVQYWEAAKWVSRLRALKTDNNLLLLSINMGSGHLGVSGRYDYYRDLAFEYAFVLDMAGIRE